MLFSILLIFGLPLGVFSDIKKGSSNTIKKVGDNVEFPCVTERRDCSDVDWAKQEGSQSSLAIYKNSSESGMLNSWRYPLDRYSVSLVDGCNLTIRNLKLSDSGLFSCIETKGASDAARHFFLAVIEHATECETNATKDIAEDSAYIDKCSVTFQPELISPSKLELSWSGGGRKTAPINSTEANIVELAYTGIAKPEVVQGCNCTVTLHVDQASPATHDKKSTSSSACTLPIRYVLHPVTKISCYSGTKEVIKEVHKSQTLECTADGYPLPSCQCKPSKTEETWSCSSFTIPETSLPGDIVTCTATNVVSGKSTTVTVTFTVTEEEPPAPVGMIAGIVVGSILLIAAICVVLFILYKKNILGGGREKGEIAVPLKEPAPPKPPRANSNQGLPL